MEQNTQITIDSNSLETLKSCESLFNHVINKKFQCTSNLESAMDSAEVFKTMLTSQIELSVWKDDLTKHTVDVVVNAANEYLHHQGGLALAISRAGGPVIQKESEAIINYRGKVPTGEIVITSGGWLPCYQIIHAVGPQWSLADEERCCIELRKVIANILNHVVSRQSGVKTVAIPALSSGIFGFPLDLCVDIIVNAIKNFPSFHKTSILKEIHLVSNEDLTVAAFKRSCEKFLSENIAAPPPLASVTLNNIYLQIINGFIEQQKVDVIVNSVSVENPFACGYISKSISDQAGTELEKEFFKKLSKTSKSQELVVVTPGFNLTCQYVYHVVWPSCNNTMKTLKDAVMNCLEKSWQQNINSISFPALGTGHINIPKEAAVQIMLEEVLQFSKKLQGKKLNVNFVIFPKDSKLSEVFKNELAKMKTKEMGQMAPTINKEISTAKRVMQWLRDDQTEAGLKEAKKPSIYLKGNNEEQLVAAKKWIINLLQSQEYHFIENNHIFYFGKEEHDQLFHLKNNFEVSISENISPGKATLEIRGRLNSIIPVILHIENLLGDVQIDFANKNFSRLTICPFYIHSQGNLTRLEFSKNKELQEKKKAFEKVGLEVQKVESIDNPHLWVTFDERKKMIESKKGNGSQSLMLYQEVPQQFCNFVVRTGFQRIYSLPPDLQYGDGIYFRRNLKNLVDNLRRNSDSDCLICVFEAEVVVGSFCKGNPSYISPPLDSRTMDTYDSVVDNIKNPETFVIFDSTQARPQFLWTCVLKKNDFSQMEIKNKVTQGTLL
ncbi:protein mono-ADP-ribosyltransferase PARP9 [Macrotis lagotis]|uniref:protein mono-ADP-ribosyltransferase PARP9 n=1 Tax=Macrotis lagotis TaxID=92651 RepID=UPI003D680D8F